MLYSPKASKKTHIGILKLLCYILSSISGLNTHTHTHIFLICMIFMNYLLIYIYLIILKFFYIFIKTWHPYKLAAKVLLKWMFYKWTLLYWETSPLKSSIKYISQIKNVWQKFIFLSELNIHLSSVFKNAYFTVRVKSHT